MHCWLSCKAKPKTSPCLPYTKAWEGAGNVCWWQLGSHSLLQTLWGKGSCFTALWDDIYAPSPQENQDSPHWVWWPSISSGSTKSLNRASWAPLLPFCLGICREAPGIVLSPSVWIWSITCHGNISLRNTEGRVTGGTSGKRCFPITCASLFLLSCNLQEAQQNLQQIFFKQNLKSVQTSRT